MIDHSMAVCYFLSIAAVDPLHRDEQLIDQLRTTLEQVRSLIGIIQLE